MNTSIDDLELLRRADALRDEGQSLQAEMLYLRLLDSWPTALPVLLSLAMLAMQRGDAERAVSFLDRAWKGNQGEEAVLLDLAMLLIQLGRGSQARKLLTAAVQASAESFNAWLLLGLACDAGGDMHSALQAYFRAIVQARRHGLWLDEKTTPVPLLPHVLRAVQLLKERRRELLVASYEEVRAQYPSGALERVDRAVAGYLREWDSTPRDPRQRPKFFYFPGLPDQQFHDPLLQPWAPRLAAAYPAIRAEAMKVLTEEAHALPDFIEDTTGAGLYVSGEGAAAWKAFFFYRHGQRHDANHARCPQTSAALESLDLCRIEDQAPEILYSVLAPGSHIKPHHGVSNVRLVMHLPLIVPSGCALNLIDRGSHEWQEGRLVMFDDTFLHEAWNRSSQTRVVLLMDCWNPHLTEPERAAVKLLLEAISALHRSDRLPAVWRES